MGTMDFRCSAESPNAFLVCHRGRQAVEYTMNARGAFLSTVANAAFADTVSLMVVVVEVSRANWTKGSQLQVARHLQLGDRSSMSSRLE